MGLAIGQFAGSNRSLRLASCLLAALCLLAFRSGVYAGDVIDGIQSRDKLRCGVSEGIAGFSKPDANGRWLGLDADFCRAVAAAVLGDAGKAEFVPLKASARFPALQAGRIDLLVRNTSWTFVRETAFGVQFPAVLFYDGQGFLVPRSANIGHAAELKGATVCVEKGTTHLANLVEFAEAENLQLTPLVLDSAPAVAAALFESRCQAYSSDTSQLAAVRLEAPGSVGGPDAYTLLPERISKEPLAPAVTGRDPQWVSLVRWVLFALVLAEEHGINQENVAVKWLPLRQSKLKAWKLAGGNETNYASLVGASDDMLLNVISAVGNYGEMFERNLGRDSPLQMERGLNRLWKDGGLMYAPPVD